MSDHRLSDQQKVNGQAVSPEFLSRELVLTLSAGSTCLLVAGIHLRSGDPCPQCGAGRMDYDGLLNLTCPKCGFSPGGGSFS